MAGREFAEAKQMTFVPAYDDPRIAAGAGTAALELLEDAGELDLLVAPIGGGGLMSGAATVVKALHPGARVIGVEAQASAVTKRSLAAGERIQIPVPRHLADGQMLTQPGEWTFTVMQALVDEIVLVSDDEILDAMAFLFDRLKLVTGPSGAISTAALLAGHVRPEGARVGAIVSGGNVGLARFLDLMGQARTPSSNRPT
jgi:threonine dehydratase